MVQLSVPYMTTRKTIVLTLWTFVIKIISLLLNKLSRFVIAFLPRSKHYKNLLRSWLQSPSAVILELKETKSVIVSTAFPSICHGVMRPDTMIFVFWMLFFFFHNWDFIDCFEDHYKDIPICIQFFIHMKNLKNHIVVILNSYSSDFPA